MATQLNDGLYGAKILGAFITDNNSVGFKTVVDTVYDMSGNASGLDHWLNETVYLNFTNRDGTPNKYTPKTAASILRGLDFDTWNNFEQVVEELVRTGAKIFIEVKTTNSGKWVNIVDGLNREKSADEVSSAKRNLAMMTRGMQSEPAQKIAPASASHTKLLEILKGMNDRKEDWQSVTGGKKVRDMNEVEVKNILEKLQSGPDLTPPGDDIPF